MEFETEATRIPSSIGNITIGLTRALSEEGLPVYSAHYHVQILDQNGGTFHLKEGDLVPFLTDAQKVSSRALIDGLHQKAQRLIS